MAHHPETFPAGPSGLPATHPGELLREVVLPALKAAGTPRTQVAKILGMKRPSFYEFLAGKTPITAERALLLGKLCGNGPDLWMNLQRDWDLARARERLGPALDAVPTLKVA